MLRFPELMMFTLVQMWFKHKKIQGFYDVLQVSSYLIKNNHGGGYQKANVDNNLILQNRSFAEGADACISLRFRTCARSSSFNTLLTKDKTSREIS